MGQSLKKQGNGEGTMQEQQIKATIEKCYDEHFADPDKSDYNLVDFFYAVSHTVAEINKALGSTQLRVPTSETLENAYNKYHGGKGTALTKEEFQKILQAVILDTGVSGMGAKDMLLYIFGVPLAAVFLKQQIIPKAIPNDVFVPVVTSATVFLLAKLNKI